MRTQAPDNLSRPCPAGVRHMGAGIAHCAIENPQGGLHAIMVCRVGVEVSRSSQECKEPSE
eukprot:746328-Pelagomonas_calceolata.AAC.3